MLSDIHYAHAVLEAIERFESESPSVLVGSVPRGNFSPETHGAVLGHGTRVAARRTGQGCPSPASVGLPKEIINLENGVIQLLRPLRRINLFKVIAVEGDVDFDLLGLLLAFEVRVDGRKPKAVLESLVKATVQLHTDFETYLDRLGPASRSCPPS